MESNLTPEYIAFINNGGSLSNLTQQIIDRVQYHQDFLQELEALINRFDDPFEEVPIEVPESEDIMTSAVGTLTERRLRPEYCK